MWLKFLAVMGLGLVVAGPCRADCASFSGDSVNMTYDPLGDSATLGRFQPLALTVSRGSSVRGGGPVDNVTAQFVDEGQSGPIFRLDRGPTYVITDRDNEEVIVHQSAAPLVDGHTFSVGFGSGGAQAHTVAARPVNGLSLWVPPGQDVAAGVYSATLDVQYRCGEGHGVGDVRLQTGVLPVAITVPSVLSVNLAGGGLRGTIDFNQFETLTRSANIQVRSTGAFSLEIHAEHAGRMVLLGTSGGKGREIPYSLTFNGAPIALDSHIGYPRTGVGGLSMPLAVTVGDTSGERSGAYKDTLTLVFTPRATL